MTLIADVATAGAPDESAQLESLFDSIAAASHTEEERAPDAPHDAAKVISQIGHLTRGLHEALGQLGYDRVLQDVAETMPDARQRLAYVATMTEQAAMRALNAIDAAQPIQDKLATDASSLALDWERVFTRELSVKEFVALVERTRAYLTGVPQQTKATNAQLTDIMMAQEFQDLTGQMIKKITDMAQNMETQLLQLLVEHCPQERREVAESTGLLNGPVVDGRGRTDVVTSQTQVDDLLASLGF